MTYTVIIGKPFCCTCGLIVGVRKKRSEWRYLCSIPLLTRTVVSSCACKQAGKKQNECEGLGEMFVLVLLEKQEYVDSGSHVGTVHHILCGDAQIQYAGLISAQTLTLLSGSGIGRL